MSHQVRYQRSNPHISPVSLILYPHAHSDFTCTSRSNNLQVPTEQLQLTPLKSNFPGHIQRGARKTIKPQKVPSLPQFFLYFQEKNRKILIQARWFFQSSQNTITASPPGMGKGHNKLTGSTELQKCRCKRVMSSTVSSNELLLICALTILYTGNGEVVIFNRCDYLVTHG